MCTPVKVLYEDEYLLALDKPAGLLMHPSWIDRNETDTLAGRVKEYFVNKDIESKVHTVHRLDRPTSGVVLIAKSDEIACSLADQFKQGLVHKTYWAITRGFCPEELTVDHPLKEELDKIADKDASKEREAQSAITHFKRLAIAELSVPVSRYSKSRFSLLECKPVTGRKHQIRRHLKHIRHPILCDSRYGCRHHNKLASNSLAMSSLALRAVSIEFAHPKTNKLMRIEAPLNDVWSTNLEQFGWR